MDRRPADIVRALCRIPLVISAVFFCSACSAADDEPAFGDAIVIASISDARTLVPILASDTASSDICGMLFNGLVKYDKDVNIVGDLTEGWDVSPDGLVITFRLRKGVRWHDGEPFTARDVEFTYRKLIDPAVKTPYSGDFERIASLECVDDLTVRVTYKEPFSPALASWGMWIMPRHVLEKADLNTTDFSRHPVGTGPYRLRSWKTLEKIELVANRDYFEGRPYIDRCIYRIIPDDATIFLELQTGGVDWAGLSPLQYTRQTDNRFFRTHYNKFRYPGFGYTYIAYNLADPKFRDARVRNAINCAINKAEIVDTVFFGLAKTTTGPFLIGSWAYNDAVQAAPFDPAKARELLAGAGWKDANGDGWVEKDGKAFEFTLIVNQGNNDRLRTSEMVQKYLKGIGIRMKIRVLEWSALINDFLNKKRFEAVLMGWFLPRDPDNYDIWHSSKTREGEFNFIGYANPEVDRLLEEARRTFDRPKRAAAYRRVHEIIYGEQPYTFLYEAEALPIVSSRFRGVEPSPIGIGHNFIRWYAPRAEQRYR
jgi:peptide/nickel transport system substrate-binding protein